MKYTNYEPITGIILNIAKESDCCSQMMSLSTENGIVNFIVGPETIVIDNRQLRAGMRVTAFYDGNLPVPLIFPPQYRAQIVTVLSRNEQVMLNNFDSNFVAVDWSLQLNITGNTVIKTVNGQRFTCSPCNRPVLVYYSITTRSIPPQTTPSKIIVLC